MKKILLAAIVASSVAFAGSAITEKEVADAQKKMGGSV